MTAEVELLPCGECGMPCRPGEYHPYAACLMFKTCRNSDTVRGNMQDAQDHATAAKDAEVEALRAEVERLTSEVRCLRQQYDERTACMIVHRGAALACSDAVRAAYSEEHERADKLAEALREWWSAHRPVRWTEDQHRACPYVNLPTDTDKALAEALLRDQEEGRG